jgi:hypothetical protein
VAVAVAVTDVGAGVMTGGAAVGVAAVDEQPTRARHAIPTINSFGLITFSR